MSDRTPDRKALVLAAGRGTRLAPLTDRIPKCLVEIDGRPLLDYWLDALEACAVTDVLVNTHHLPEPVRSFLAHAREKRPFAIHESYEPELLGSAGTIGHNASFVSKDELCLIVYADNLSTVDLGALVAFHLSHEDPCSMLLFHTSRPRECGIATLDDAGRIVEFTEKPEAPASDLANAGVYVVDGALYAEIAAMGAFDIGFDVLPRLVGRMRGYAFEGFHLDIGNLEALERARREAPSLFGSHP
jgi:mannose-1-phosphate guanylyltransferase